MSTPIYDQLKDLLNKGLLKSEPEYPTDESEKPEEDNSE